MPGGGSPGNANILVLRGFAPWQLTYQGNLETCFPHLKKPERLMPFLPVHCRTTHLPFHLDSTTTDALWCKMTKTGTVPSGKVVVCTCCSKWADAWESMGIQ